MATQILQVGLPIGIELNLEQSIRPSFTHPTIDPLLHLLVCPHSITHDNLLADGMHLVPVEAVEEVGVVDMQPGRLDLPCHPPIYLPQLTPAHRCTTIAHPRNIPNMARLRLSASRDLQ